MKTMEEKLLDLIATLENENLDRIEESVDHEFRIIELEFQIV